MHSTINSDFSAMATAASSFPDHHATPTLQPTARPPANHLSRRLHPLRRTTRGRRKAPLHPLHGPNTMDTQCFCLRKRGGATPCRTHPLRGRGCVAPFQARQYCPIHSPSNQISQQPCLGKAIWTPAWSRTARVGTIQRHRLPCSRTTPSPPQTPTRI